MEPQNVSGEIALKTHSGHYLSFDAQAASPHNDAEPVYLGDQRSSHLLEIRFLDPLKDGVKPVYQAVLQTESGLCLSPLQGGGKSAPAGASGWNFSTDATDVGPNQRFKIFVDELMREKRSRSVVIWDVHEVNSARETLHPLLTSPLMNEIRETVKKTGLHHASVAQHLSRLRGAPEIAYFARGEGDKPRISPRPSSGSGPSRARDYNFSGDVMSVSLNFFWGGAVGLGINVTQSIIFDLFEDQPGSGVAVYGGSTSVGVTLGLQMGIEAGASVSINWFSARDSGGGYSLVQETAAIVGGVYAAEISTKAGSALEFGVGIGLDIGIAGGGGFTFYEGGDYYNLPSGPTAPPPPPPGATFNANRAYRIEIIECQTHFPATSGIVAERIFSFRSAKFLQGGRWGTFYVFPNQEPGTVPVYEHLLSAKDSSGNPVTVPYYSTRGKIEGFKAPAQPCFYVPPKAIPGRTKPVHLCVKPSSSPQLYWYTSIGRDGDLPEGFVYSGIAFHAPDRD